MLQPFVKPQFPAPVKFNERKYFPRSAIDNFKMQLQAFSLGVAPPPPFAPVEPDCFVPVKRVAAEFGVSIRTIDRWIAEAQGSKAA